MSRRECKLLPHTRQNLYGLEANALQFLPWSIKKFDIEKAWDKSQGENVIVAVVDTGCDMDHEDLKDNLLQGKNFVDMNNNPNDGNGHGTHVAGTIAAANNEYGMVGIAPKAKILPVKVLGDDGSGSNNSVANGILWAVDNGAELITMSLGSPHTSRNIERAIDYAVKNGVVVFCAAGNSGNDTEIMYPANYLQTISIGAINHQLMVSQFSCCGDNLDFVAPGEDIISAIPNNSYAKMTGTSMATPYAVGCAALALSYNKKYGKTINSKIEYVDIFKKNALPISGPQRNDRRYQGHGVIRPIY